MASRWIDLAGQAVGGATSRRRLVTALAAGGLLALLELTGDDEDALAKDRRRRRKQRHRKRGNAGKRKGRCRRQSQAKLCAGRCGTRRNCRRKVDCGGCNWAGEVCTPQQVCAAQTCSTNADCPADGICDNGVCVRCTVTCNAGDHVCDGAALQTAIAAGGTVVVCPGRYVGSFETPADTPVTIIGAGMGDDPAANTVLDANFGGRVVVVPDAATAAFRRVRITRGQGFSGCGIGGGLYSHVTIVSCAIVGNSDGTCHGAGARLDGMAEITDSVFSDNAGWLGGALYFDGDEAQQIFLRRTEVRDNTAQRGAGLYGDKTQVFLLDHSLITLNITSNPGDAGGIDTGMLAAITISADSSVTGNTPFDCSIGGPLVGTCG